MAQTSRKLAGGVASAPRAPGGAAAAASAAATSQAAERRVRGMRDLAVDGRANGAGAGRGRAPGIAMMPARRREGKARGGRSLAAAAVEQQFGSRIVMDEQTNSSAPGTIPKRRN